MTESFKDWYKSLSITNQLFISFVFNIFFWFIFSLLMDRLLWNQNRSIQYTAFYAVLMAFFFTIIVNWAKIRGLFKGNKV